MLAVTRDKRSACDSMCLTYTRCGCVNEGVIIVHERSDGAHGTMLSVATQS